MVLRSVGEQISDVAYLASDTCFFFPVVPEAPFGASLETIAADGRTNAYGRRCLVQRMNTYPDALDIAKPAGHSSAAVSALTLSQGLPMMLDNIRAAARTNQTFVIHCVAVKVAGNNFELVPDETATEQAIATGAAVVVAPSALSCYDSAIYAHALSRSLGKPVVHIIDGSLGLAGRTSASEPWDALAQRGLDDAGAKSEDANTIHDINFREVLDTVIDGPIYLRALGLGDWDVHGWVGALQDIPRAGHNASMAN